jgi:isopenicillin N synthase-like dioxygenase
VLIGDMIERWSNGPCRATPHRVPATAWPRRSIVMFLAADPGLEVTPLEAFVDAANPPRYQVVTQDGQIREAMARAEVNRQAMLPQVEKLRGEISPG